MIVLDTSAILAVLLAEDEAAVFRDLISQAGRALVSAGTAIELAAVASRDDELLQRALEFLKEPFVHLESVDADQANIAAQAYRRYGKGHDPAGLDLGDIFAYALARQRGAPLLFKGEDFAKMDVKAAVSQ